VRFVGNSYNLSFGPRRDSRQAFVFVELSRPVQRVARDLLSRAACRWSR
jgi:hypothetical protein